ncbi:mechanosensitive ion channel domain-containing protein [Cecembia lonarensis]|uniref:Potassium efflux system KefA n=1 Tax=Cecembia lonarensis (strain CCUG 58316 / KCTC 22772 / LW9) TaxID=1225176 RepID=K1M4G4_CECL9|nr:mechanosensitive ion channel domain-containing protein [Cecembia lonarensis]EKB51144.1 Potassium efflux system KefA precursor [Cecembia lonarensis LW9]
MHIFFKIVLVFCSILLSTSSLYAQGTPTTSSPIDSLILVEEEEGIQEKEKIDRVTLEENIKKAQTYTIALNRINQRVNDFMDTASIDKAIPSAERYLEVVGRRLENQDVKINIRYLNALENWLNYIVSDLNEADGKITRRVDELFSARLKVDSIKQDEIMRISFRDTTLLPEYQLTLSNLNTNLLRVDSTLNARRLLVAGYRSKVSSLLINLNLLEEKILSQKRVLERALFEKETNYIWEPREFPSTERLIFIFRDSFRFNLNITRNYINKHPFISITLLLSIFLLTYWVKKYLISIQAEKDFSALILKRFKYVNRYPFLSSVLVILAIAPFFFPNPPISFFAFILILKVSISGVLLRKRVGSDSMKIWWILFALFLISVASNLYWEVAYQERWHLLAFNLLGIYLGWKLIYLEKEKEEALPQYIPLVAKIYIAFCFIAILANVLGRFSLGKMIGITATLSLMHAVPLIIFIAIIKELIYLRVEVGRSNESGFTSVIDFYNIQKRVNRIASYLAVFIWGYFFLESLGILETILFGVEQFLIKPRSIMNASFTFGQIGIFILILYIAVFLANVVAYISSLRDQQTGNLRGKKLGSTVLLIRLALLITGFLIAAAASGISLDKIAIILGAFSLGISFGLQTIVNNLVSGVILAFEKPIQIGDTVQVGNVEGIVKDIGIRASKIKNWDGAEVIIPNGDLLAQSLTNWTLSDKQRRVELIIGVSYNADMDQVTQLIQKQLEVEGILNSPPSRVLLQTFADNSVNFRVLFWVEDIDVWITIRDRVMRGIFKSFKEHGVEIPFPQRDLHVKSFPGLIQEKVFKADD